MEVKKAQSQDEMRRGDVGGGSRPPRGGSGDYGYGGRGGDAYRSGSSYYKMGMGGAGDYSRMQGGWVGCSGGGLRGACHD